LPNKSHFTQLTAARPDPPEPIRHAVLALGEVAELTVLPRLDYKKIGRASLGAAERTTSAWAIRLGNNVAAMSSHWPR
jgi:hypothetical protein